MSAVSGREVANAVLTISSFPEDDVHLSALVSILDDADRNALLQAVFRLAGVARGLATVVAESRQVETESILKYVTD